MFEFNVTGFIRTLQSADYLSIFYNMVSTTYLELLIFTIGIFFYVVFIWFFYRILSKRDLFKLDLSKYEIPGMKWKRTKKTGSVFLYILKYGIAFPFYVGFWFAVLSVLMFVMTKDVPVRQIILISITLVSAVRIISYLNEDLSRDLAKLVPFALLAIFLIDPNFFSWGLLVERLAAIYSMGWEIFNFLSFCIMLEWALRILYSIKISFSRKTTDTL